MKTGQVYLMVDPEFDTKAAVNVRRIWAPRVKVFLLKRHLFALNQHHRYEVLYNNRRYFTGRLERIKEPCR